MTYKSLKCRFFMKPENCRDTTIRESDIQRHVASSDIGGDRKPWRDFFVPGIGSHRSVNFNIIRVGGKEGTPLAREIPPADSSRHTEETI